MNLFYLTLPIVALFVAFYVGFSILPPEPFTMWWDVPVAAVLFMAVIYSMYISLVNIT